jgi:hypothetical protein
MTFSDTPSPAIDDAEKRNGNMKAISEDRILSEDRLSINALSSL